MQYDYLIVGAGLYGAVFAREMTDAGRTCMVIDKRAHIAGNIYTEKINGIDVHQYGAHIFHTSDKQVWAYVNRFAEFNQYINAPVANYKGELYNLPFNMNTFNKMWGVITPAQAQEKLAQQRAEAQIDNPQNLEEQALSLVGRDIYEKLVKGYTEKQWGRSATELPGFIIKRLPVRFVYDNNYFNDRYQGIPLSGYTDMVAKMLDGVTVKTGCDFKACVTKQNGVYTLGEDTFKTVVYTGMIDAFFDYVYGPLAYRSLRFETETLPEVDNYQGNAVVNYTEREVPYTRIIEHKHFLFGKDPQTDEVVSGTIVTKEYPADWQQGDEPYYPVNDQQNAALYARYTQRAAQEKDVIFGGRLGQYRYYDMDKVVRAALDAVREILQK